VCVLCTFGVSLSTVFVLRAVFVVLIDADDDDDDDDGDDDVCKSWVLVIDSFSQFIHFFFLSFKKEM
jgi:hypothetical protein